MRGRPRTNRYNEYAHRWMFGETVEVHMPDHTPRRDWVRVTIMKLHAAARVRDIQIKTKVEGDKVLSWMIHP